MTVMLELPTDLEERLREKATEKEQETTSSPLPKRIGGLNRGQVLWISDDFDMPLSDEFWQGQL